MDSKVHLQIGQVGRNNRILINGEDVSHMVVGVSVESSVDSISRVVLTLAPREVVVEGDADVLKVEPVLAIEPRKDAP